MVVILAMAIALATGDKNGSASEKSGNSCTEGGEPSDWQQSLAMIW